MYHSSQKILSTEQFSRKLAVWHFKEEKIVFTNGIFDLLHLGHVDYLEQARRLGTKLVVGVNSDASAGRLKPGRPLQDEQARLRIVAALEFVDAVILFEEDTPIKLIEQIKPGILVKGADYEVAAVVGYDFVLANGGEVQTLTLVEGYSTTALIARAKALKGD